MKLTVFCQICNSVLVTVNKDLITNEDIDEYENSCFCNTVQGTSIDANGNSILNYDGKTSVQSKVE